MVRRVGSLGEVVAAAGLCEGGKKMLRLEGESWEASGMEWEGELTGLRVTSALGRS
jgi:hypothetical protein